MKKQFDLPANQLKSPLNLTKIPSGQSLDYQLSKKQDWVGALLKELNEAATALPEMMKFDQTKLDISCTLQRHYNNELGEYLTCTGHVTAQFFTECVKTLATMKDKMETDFKAMFIDISFSQKPEYEELTEYYHDQNIYDLYYFERRLVDIKEMLHEVIWLNIDPYPTRD